MIPLLAVRMASWIVLVPPLLLVARLLVASLIISLAFSRGGIPKAFAFCHVSAALVKILSLASFGALLIGASLLSFFVCFGNLDFK